MKHELTKCSAILVSARENICSTLTFANYYMPPIPTFIDRELCLTVFLGRGEYLDSESGYMIWRPHLMANYLVGSGSMHELRGIGCEPSESEAGAPLGKGIAPLEKNEAEYLGKQVRYCEAADRVLDSWNIRSYENQLGEDLRSKFVSCSDEILIDYFDNTFLASI